MEERSGPARPVVKNDLGLYDRHADCWWRDGHPAFRSLRSVKAFHLELLRERCAQRLAGAVAVDLGCGGGLLSLPLAEAGATVVGVDVSGPSLQAARREARRRGLPARFVRSDLRRTPLRAACADVVLLSDVLEHVEDPVTAVREAARLLRTGGLFFANTFDRGPVAAFVVVTLAEGLGLVPRGTHDPRLFVRPDELEALCARASLRPLWRQHETVALLPTIASWTVHLRRSRSGVGYSAAFQKDGVS